jgi:7-cyano-7-deazaguanine reductase
MLEQLDNSNISKHLGKSSEYIKTYDKSLLVREPRQSNRKHLNISDEAPPFVGYDVWGGYEVSCLLNNGLPFAGSAKVTYPATNKYIVESKAMKLYWNSFNMTCMGATADEAINNIEQVASKDLSELLETQVHVKLFSASLWEVNGTADPIIGCNQSLEELYPDTACNTYSETPELLVTVDQHDEHTTVNRHGLTVHHSSLLKSNCRVTGAPDFGDVIIKYRGSNIIDPRSLLKYIVSFRDECHFHEEICEALYKRIWDKFAPDELSVTCLYTRRGGWHIQPSRVSHDYLLDDGIHPQINVLKTSRQ